ncbi:Lrp/AsnC family transcriptional regulator [Nocardia xishanensis]
MQDDATLLSEDDLALINALQLRPRGSWSELGHALGVDPVTVARRWQRLTRRGAAWVSPSPGPRLLDQITIAYVEIGCTADAAAAVSRSLCEHPHMVTVERCAGTYNLLATVAARDLAAMSHYTLDVLPAVPHVAAVRARIVTHMFTEGSRWRIDALAPDQRAELHIPSPQPTVPVRAVSIDDADRALVAQLALDGRASHQSLATAVGSSASTVKRRLDRLVRLGLLQFRCDFARPLGGWPVAVTLWLDAPPDRLAELGDAIIRLPQTRNCAAISGGHNLLIQANLHSLADIPRLEAGLAAAHPALRIAERTVTLRHDKLFGHLLDPRGRSRRVVRADIWSEPAATV